MMGFSNQLQGEDKSDAMLVSSYRISSFFEKENNLVYYRTACFLAFSEEEHGKGDLVGFKLTSEYFIGRRNNNKQA